MKYTINKEHIPPEEFLEKLGVSSAEAATFEKDVHGYRNAVYNDLSICMGCNKPTYINGGSGCCAICDNIVVEEQKEMKRPILGSGVTLIDKQSRKCGSCRFYIPDEFEIGSGKCIEIQKREDPDEKVYVYVSVISTDSECDGKYWQQGERNIVQCHCGEGYVDISKEIHLGGKIDSWQNFFDVIFHTKNSIQRADGQSLGNFWAFVQKLQDNFTERGT